MTEFDGMRWCFRAFALSTCIITIPVAFYNLPIYIIINIYILVLYIVGETDGNETQSQAAPEETAEQQTNPRKRGGVKQRAQQKIRFVNLSTR